MANTILEKLQDMYPYAEGINDARNIAEAVACVTDSGGRGAGAIADHVGKVMLVTYRANGADGDTVSVDHLVAAPINLIKDPCTKFNWTAPAGKTFAGWGTYTNATTPLTDPVYGNDLPSGKSLYAIWVGGEE